MIAAWYSVIGLTAIFAAAVTPIIIMGTALEIAKVVTTVWLHRYWERASWRLKAYLVPAVIALACLTSMGIFGLLSKAHSDQSLVSGDVLAKVELIDETIKISRDNIAMNQQTLDQMNNQVDQLLGRTDDARGANRAVQVRRQQASERTRLTAEIEAEQAKIAKLNEEAAPIRAEIRKIEAEVGPIKYIAAMIYGDNPDANLLERAVRWIIVLIVCVFDPLALILVLAAQSSYRWLEEDEKRAKEESGLKKIIEEAQSLDHKLDDIKDELETIVAAQEKQQEEAFAEAFVETKGTVDSELDLGFDSKDLDISEPESEPEPQSELEPVESDEEPEVQSESLPEASIVTEGQTIQETDGGYIQYQGKSMRKDALAEIHPELFKAVPDSVPVYTSFGTEFPKFAKKGDLFVRVDVLPHKTFRFSGSKWFEINKEQTNTYLYDVEYIKHLVNKIDSGEYDVELLSDNEKEQIKEFLDSNNDK